MKVAWLTQLVRDTNYIIIQTIHCVGIEPDFLVLRIFLRLGRHLYQYVGTDIEVFYGDVTLSNRFQFPPSD